MQLKMAILSRKIRMQNYVLSSTLLHDRFLSFGSPFGSTNLSIDESMIPYYGQNPTKEFIRGKPIRWGYKAWVPAEPLGYAYHIDKDDLLSFTRF